MEIAVSYSRKLNHALYGGNQYENSDYFASLKLEIDDEQNPKPVHEDLSRTCKEMVEEAVENEIMDISGGLSPQDWDKWLQGVLRGKWGSAEDFEGMSPYQQRIAQSLKRAHKRNKYQDNKKSDE